MQIDIGSTVYAVRGNRYAILSKSRQMKWLGIAVLLLSLSNSDAWSQTTSDSNDPKARMASELLKVISPVHYVSEAMTLAFEGQPIVGQPGFLSRVQAKLDNDRLSSDLHGVFMKYYTIEELRALRDFYASPEGNSALRKRPRVLKEITGVVEREIARAVTDAMAETK